MTILAILCALMCLVAGGFALAAATFNGRYHHKASASFANKAAMLLAPVAVALTIVYYLIRGIEYGTVTLALFTLIMAFHLWRERARESGRSSERIPDRDGISGAAHSRLFWGGFAGLLTGVMLIVFEGTWIFR